MKICLVHNKYGKFSGEEAVVYSQAELLEANGHEVVCFTRSSEEIPAQFFGEVRAFFSGIYNPFVQKAFRAFLRQEQPDIVHIHNLFPLISPAVLDVCHEMKLPVVMTVHNYRLICPNGLFMSNGEICERCSHGREYWCVLRNCEGNLFKSLGYALRNVAARWRRAYLDHVQLFAVLTEFQRQKLIDQGFNPERIVVLPNMTSPPVATNDQLGDYIGYVGRISQEKGVDTLLETARLCPKVDFKAAGAYEKCPELPETAPSNFQFLGQLSREELVRFFTQSRIIILCSKWYEGFPMVLVEAMFYGKPVIVSRIGGLSEIVDHNVTGLFFESGNAVDLAEKITYLWGNPELCNQMGKLGKKKALREYTPEKYYLQLIRAYNQARDLLITKMSFK